MSVTVIPLLACIQNANEYNITNLHYYDYQLVKATFSS